MEVYNTKGKLVISDIWMADMPTTAELLQLVEHAISISGMHILDTKVVNFEPYDAVTAIYVLSESHFSLHTYPEHNYISVDCYTCGDEANPEVAIKHIIGQLNVIKNTFQCIERGII